MQRIWSGRPFGRACRRCGYVKNNRKNSRVKLAGVGTTGYSTGPHLHYQVMYDGNNVDGMSLIDFSDKNTIYKPDLNNGYIHNEFYNPNNGYPLQP